MSKEVQYDKDWMALPLWEHKGNKFWTFLTGNLYPELQTCHSEMKLTFPKEWSIFSPSNSSVLGEQDNQTWKKFWALLVANFKTGFSSANTWIPRIWLIQEIIIPSWFSYFLYFTLKTTAVVTAEHHIFFRQKDDCKILQTANIFFLQHDFIILNDLRIISFQRKSFHIILFICQKTLGEPS